MRPDPAAAPAAAPLGLLFCVTAIAPLGLNVIVPALPAIGASFEAPHSMVQLTLSLYLLGYALAQLVLGPLSDRLGRRPVLLASTAMFVGGSLGAALAQDMPGLIAARICQSLGGCAALVVPRAAVRDAYQGPAAVHAMTRVTLALAVVPALAPLVAGLLVSGWGWRAVFFFCTAYGAAMFIWQWMRLAETLPPQRRLADGTRAVARRHAALLRSPTYVAYVANMGLLGVGLMVFLSVAPPLLIGGLGMSPAAYGFCQLLLGVPIVAGGLLASRAAHRLGLDGALLLASVLAIVGLALTLLLAEQLTVARLVGPMLIYALASGACLPLALTGATSVAPHAAGVSAAMAGFGQMALGATGVFVVNQFDSLALPFAAFSLACALLGTGLLAVLRRGRVPAA